MFFTKLKEKVHYFFVKKNKTLQNKPKNLSKDKIKNVLVLLDVNEDKNLIKRELEHFLNSKKITIDFIFFHPNSSMKKKYEDCITPSDFGWFGSIPTHINELFLTKNYNLLINYCKVDYTYINTLLLHCKIDFLVSYSHIDNQLYDLQIACDSDDIKLFTHEIKKYLTILNKLL